MKQKIPKHVLLISFLLAGMIFSFSKVANATEEVKKQIEVTICCLNGQATGTSNNCITGSGNCVNHHCATGEYESNTPSCPGN